MCRVELWPAPSSMNMNIRICGVVFCLLTLPLHQDATAATAAAQLKAPLVGLVVMGDIHFHRQDGGLAHPSLEELRPFPDIFGGVVINITWEQLEPTRGVLHTEAIDRVLGEMRTYNQAHPRCPIGARLRVWPGPNAPAWAKNLGGAPVSVLHREMPISVGRFWAKPYRDAWRELQLRLAARYDSEPLIREISNTSGSSITCEAMLLPGDSRSIKNLLAAGFTDKQYQACLGESSADYAGWVTTRVEWPCNPYRAITSGKTQADPEFTLKLMRHWRQTLGSRGILGNYALAKPLPDHLLVIYAELRRLGPPIALETQSPGGLDWEGTLRLGLSYGASSIELWSGTKFGGIETKTPQILRAWAALFK